MWVSVHVTQNEANACEAARVLVTSDCPFECGACKPAAAGCSSGEDEDMFLKRYDGAIPTVASRLAVGQCAMFAFVGAVVGVATAVTALARGQRARRAAYSDELLVQEQA